MIELQEGLTPESVLSRKKISVFQNSVSNGKLDHNYIQITVQFNQCSVIEAANK